MGNEIWHLTNGFQYLTTACAGNLKLNGNRGACNHNPVCVTYRKTKWYPLWGQVTGVWHGGQL